MRKKDCTRCCQNKNADEFRVRTKKGYTYLNPTCRVCEREIRREYGQKVKNNPAWVAKNRKNAAAYRAAHLEECNRKQRERVATKEWKEYMTKYRNDNRERIRGKSRLTGGKWAKRQREEISEQYILQLLTHTREDLGDRAFIRQNYPELINFYQSHIKFKRKWKSQTSHS